MVKGGRVTRAAAACAGQAPCRTPPQQLQRDECSAPGEIQATREGRDGEREERRAWSAVRANA